MWNFPQKWKFHIFAWNCMSFSTLWNFSKKCFGKIFTKIENFLRSKNQSDIFVLSRPSRTMYTSATVVPVKGGQRKSMIAFWVKQSTKKFQNSKLWENLLENLGVREDFPDPDQPWIFHKYYWPIKINKTDLYLIEI